MRKLVAWLIGVSLALGAAHPADAVMRCGVMRLRDGTIKVRATGVTGTLAWGGQLGQEVNAFYNAATCVAGSWARGCVLGAEGTPQRSTPPPTCTIFLADASGARCSAYLSRCMPSPLPLPCPLFPSDNVWNADVSALPVHALSDTYVASIGVDAPVHPDFGSGLYDRHPIGIPYTVVPAIQPLVPITSFWYPDESDPGPYPIPPFAPIEGGTAPGRGSGDRHVLIVQEGTCRLFEIYAARCYRNGAWWTAGSEATWDLNSNGLRPDGWTSADAAGLPILPGLLRYDEIVAGAIHHAIRFTAPATQRAYVWPALHFASDSTDPSLPPLGIRLRLKASVDLSGFSPTNQIILTALKRYGMLLADNGSPWFIGGTPDARWDNDDLHALTQLHGGDFEVVDESSLMVSPDSGQVH